MSENEITCGSENKTFKYWMNYLCYSNPEDGNVDYPDAKIGSLVMGSLCLTE